METLIQQSTRLNQEKYQQEQGKLGAFAGKVVSVTPTADEVGMSYGPAPERRMPVQHPFVSQNSWMRSMPEVGTVFLMQNRFDTGQAEAIKTIPAFSRNKSDDYQAGLNVYRPLQPGEHDMASNGYAFAYFSNRGNLDLRSGANIKTQLNREAQEHATQAPTMKRNMLYQAPGVMGDEERLGTVKRWTDASTEFYVKLNDQFTSERYLQMTNPAKSGPAVLLRHIEGQVFDDDGTQLNHTTTAIPLRSQSLWYTTTDEFLKREIDQNGNMLFDFPTTATTGWEVQIPNGSFRQVIGVDRDVTIEKDERVVVKGNIHYTVDGNAQYDVTKDVTWNAGSNSLEMLAGAGSVHLLNGSSFGMTALKDAVNITAPSGTSLKFASSGATTLTAKQTLTLKVDQMMTMEGLILNANFTSINLGKGAAIPAVLGLTLQAYLDAHTHTGNLGLPTSPPIIPSAQFNGTPTSIVSLKIMLAGNT